jgi:1-deoxy-D-xylulose-5-phosphate synthase
MLDYAISLDSPVAIKYPKSYSRDFEKCEPIEYGKWEILKREGDTVILASSAKAVDLAMQIDGVTVVNARFVKPLDFSLLNSILDMNIITIEDGLLRGGFGENVLSYLTTKGYGKTFKSIGYKDEFITSTERRIVDENNGFTKENLISIVNNMNKTL